MAGKGHHVSQKGRPPRLFSSQGDGLFEKILIGNEALDERAYFEVVSREIGIKADAWVDRATVVVPGIIRMKGHCSVAIVRQYLGKTGHIIGDRHLKDHSPSDGPGWQTA